MFCELSPTFVEVTGEKLVGGPFASPPHLLPILIRVKWSVKNIQSFTHNLRDIFT